MNKFFQELRKRLMKGKFCINRAKTYATIITSGMVLFIFLSKLKDLRIINIELEKYFLGICFIGLLVLFIIGWIDINLLKATQAERTITFNLCPPFVEMKKKIDDLWEDKYGKI